MKKILKPLVLKCFDGVNAAFFKLFMAHNRRVIRSRNRLVSHLPGERVLVLAPHADDETIGCGGALLDYRARGKEVSILFLTNGNAGGRDKSISPREIMALRRQEAVNAASGMGIPEDNLIFLDVDDQGLLYSSIEGEFATIMARLQPDTLFLPCCLDHHIDHMAVSKVVAKAYDHSPELYRETALYLYEAQSPLTQFHANVTLDITPYYQGKNHALSVYKSQKNTFKFCRDANKVNGLVYGLAACEVFVSTDIHKYAELCRHIFAGEEDPPLRARLVPHRDSRTHIKSYLSSLRHKKPLRRL